MGTAAPGTNTEKPHQPLSLKVATLNYSGILLSPYEFYEQKREDETDETSKLDKNMKEILKRQFPHLQFNEIDFKIGELDKSWQKGRFSPIYEPQCGVKKGSFSMMNKREFEQEWDKYKKKNSENLKQIYENYSNKKMLKKQNPLQSQQLLNNCKKFDCMLYEAILRTVYEKEEEQKELRKFDSDSFNLKTTKYLTHRIAKFSKAFINQKFKIKKTIEIIEKQKIDILFVQEASRDFIESIEKHSIDFRVCKGQRDSNCKSAIIIRLQKFPKAQSLVIENTRFLNNVRNLKSDSKNNSRQRMFLKDLKEELNFNGDTVIQFIYNIILICPHLTSNQSQNQTKLKQSKKVKNESSQNKNGEVQIKNDQPQEKKNGQGKKQNDRPQEKKNGEGKKKQDNQAQTILLNNAIIRLRTAFPDCHIIVGGDLNNENYSISEIKIKENHNQVDRKISEKKGPDDQSKSYAKLEEKISLKDIVLVQGSNCIFNVFPDSPKNFVTSFKKRTYLQAQPKKAEEEIRSTKDYIITDLKIDKDRSKVIFFGDQQKPQFIQKPEDLTSYIPTNNHPYDHFMVFAEVYIHNKLEHVTDVEYLQKYEPGRLTSEDYKSLMQRKEEEEKLKSKITS